jgi:hypothetical protein
MFPRCDHLGDIQSAGVEFLDVHSGNVLYHCYDGPLAQDEIHDTGCSNVKDGG